MLWKDLRYPARRLKAQQDAESVQKIIADEVDGANQFLKTQGARVRLLKNANSIQLTATLQLLISSVLLTLTALRRLLKKRFALMHLVKAGKFFWEEYLPQEKEQAVGPNTWEEVILLYEEHYWITHAKNRKTLNTWDKSYVDLFKKLDLDAAVSNDSIDLLHESRSESKFKVEDCCN